MTELREEIGEKTPMEDNSTQQNDMGRAHTKMGSEKLPKKVLQADEGGRRRKGRRKLRWEDSLKIDLRRVVLNSE